jgi:hypothetical protein
MKMNRLDENYSYTKNISMDIKDMRERFIETAFVN